MSSFAVILLAAGRSSRFKDKEKKPYADLDGRAVWLRSLELFSIREDVGQILIVISPEDKDLFERRYRANVAFLSNAKVVMGGAERHDSVTKALALCSPDCDYIAVHDAARPCVTRELIEAVFTEAQKTGAAILATPVHDTIKRAGEGDAIVETLPRDRLWLAQTPQVFSRPLLLEAYAQKSKVPGAITDDAQLVENVGGKVSLVKSDLSNLKITTRQDLLLASAILKSRPKPKDAAGLHPFGDDQMWR
jgi:2-C-methyl-D-erythritol 4-phosphate cytidylyltransferase